MSDIDPELVERRSHELEVARSRIEPICVSWAESLVNQGGATLKPIRQLATDTGTKAAQFAKDGAAFIDWQPGNSTSYKAVLYDLRRPQVDALVAAGREPEAAARIGPEHSFGGRLLASFVGLGRCCAMALTDLYHPSFVADHFELRSAGDYIPLAILLSLFGAQACVWLDDEATR